MKKTILLAAVIGLVAVIALSLFQKEEKTAEIKESNMARVGEQILSNGILVTPLMVNSDSRCATDVTCITAGAVSLKTKLESFDTQEVLEFNLTSGVPMTFAGKKITLTEVSPAPVSTKTIDEKDYVFTFKVVNVSYSVNEMIQVVSPVDYGMISSPFTAIGQAKGPWFFEGSFPVTLEDADGKVLATSIAQAQGEWMTTEFVPFGAVLQFPNPTTPTGKLIFHKNNPSDMREFDDRIEVIVSFPISIESTPENSN